MSPAAPLAPSDAPTRTPRPSSARASRRALPPGPLPPGPIAGPSPGTSFAARFRAELASRPAGLLAALLATMLAAALLANNATARATTPPPPPGHGEPVPAVADRPGHGDGWVMNARAAAATCPGLPAEVLVAIGHVETRLGNHLGPSPAGALGPMQFLPATWSAYGTDGDGDGSADVMNRLDALHGAARFLCSEGGADPGRLRSALWAYNHSDDYVERVVRVAELVP